jgi:hypothetical protein
MNLIAHFPNFARKKRCSDGLEREAFGWNRHRRRGWSPSLSSRGNPSIGKSGADLLKQGPFVEVQPLSRGPYPDANTPAACPMGEPAGQTIPALDGRTLQCLFAIDTVNRYPCSHRPHRRSARQCPGGAGRVSPQPGSQHPKSNGKTSVCPFYSHASNK